MAVAVLIVNYCAYEDLERCVASLGPFLGPDDEVVVVDYESDEARLRFALACCPRAVSVRRRDNQGFAAGVNLAAQHSRAPYLLLLNPDTDVLGPVPRVLEAWLSAHPATGVVGPSVLNTDGSVQPSARRFPGPSTLFGGRSTWLTSAFPGNWLSRRNMPARGATEAVDVDWVAGACLMTTRRVFEEVGGLDESFFLYWEDADYCRRVAERRRRCTYLPTVAVRHSGGACAEYALARAIREFHRSAFRLYWKHCGSLGRVFAPVVRVGLYLRGEMRLRRARRDRAQSGDADAPLAVAREPSAGLPPGSH